MKKHYTGRGGFSSATWILFDDSEMESSRDDKDEGMLIIGGFGEALKREGNTKFLRRKVSREKA